MAKFHLKEYPALRKMVEEMDVETLLGYVVCPASESDRDTGD